MSEPRRCPQCDAEILANSPAGLCPKCLLLAASDSQSPKRAGAAPAEPGPTKLTPPNSGFVPPTVSELAALLPQLEILELLGKGGMGAVYKARQRRLDRMVAVKILPSEISHDPAFAERFVREARALAKLNHPHIVGVYDFGQTFDLSPPAPLPRGAREEAKNQIPLAPSGRGAGGEGQLCYFVMEYVEGTNLRQLIQRGELKSDEALAIIPQICEALQYAHEQGVVHRDIKPENILIDTRGRVKIADFGLAKLLDHDAADHSLTATHQVMGTLRYMAPEQMQGSREVDHRADIYSLGVVFYELLTGELPMGKFAPPSKKVQVDVRLDEVVLRALEQDPEQRYQHASEVKSEIDTISRTPLPANVTRPESAKGVESKHAVTATPFDDPGRATQPQWEVAIRAWWFAQSDRTRRILWIVLNAAFVLSLLSFCSFSGQAKSDGSYHYEIGAFDPWLIHEWLAEPGPRFRGFSGLVFGWSWLFGFAAYAFGWLLFKLRVLKPAPALIQQLPRFSRFAIAGAVWAIFGLLTVIPTLYFIGLNRVWSGEALPTDVIHSEPPLVFSIFMGALLAIGAGAPIGTTIFGSVALGHIKQSEGRIIGLPLAFADAIFFPLVVVFAGIALPCALVLRSMLSLQLVPAVFPGAALAAVVCFAFGLVLWQKIGPPRSPATAESPEEVRSKLRLAGIGLLIAGIADAAAGCVWIGSNISGLWTAWQQAAPTNGQFIHTFLSLSTIALAYYVIGIGLWLLRLDEECDPSIPLLCAAIAPPGCVVGLPAAIYAFVQLTKPEAKRLILQKRPEPETPAPASDDAPPTSAGDQRRIVRPKLIPLLAAMNLVGSIFLLLISAADTSTESTQNMPRVWQVWEQIDSVLCFIMAAGLFMASIGLFLRKSWARRLILAVCVYGLASIVLDAPYIARIALPDFYAEVHRSLASDGVDPDARDFVAMFTVVTFIGGFLLVFLAWLIGQLVYFTRPRVVAAFASSNERSNRFIEWLFTGTGAIVGVLSVFGPIALLIVLATLFNPLPTTVPTTKTSPPPPPPLGMITSGIGAEFTVPAGQVAVFEIVTRRNGETVPVPPHCGYVMAPEGNSVAATFRWSRSERDGVESRRNVWSLEIVTAGGGRGYSEGALVPDELNAAVGARGLSLGILEPNEETIHWGTQDVRDLPDNGSIGLRVTVVAHGMNHGGSGNAHIDWNKSQSATSTTRRKLSNDKP